MTMETNLCFSAKTSSTILHFLSGHFLELIWDRGFKKTGDQWSRGHVSPRYNPL